MTIGETLKRARKKMNLELDDVARSTKIAKMFIIALESDDISSLPKGVYTRIFLRTYARLLKLDEDIITTEYHEQFSVKSHFVAQKEQTRWDNLQYMRDRNKAIVIFMLMILLPVIGAVGYFMYKDELSVKFEEWMGKSPAVVEPGPDQDKTSLNQTLSEMTDPVAESPLPPREKGEVSPGEKVGPVEEGAASSKTDVPTQVPEDPTETAVDAAKPEADSSVEADETAADEPALAEKKPVSIGLPQSLPVRDVASVSWTPEGKSGTLAQMFAIESLAQVWIKVVIDGEVLTERFLSPGMTRYYRYGQTHTVLIGMTNRVAVQSGEVFREKAHDVNSLVVLKFGPDGFLEALDRGVALALARNKE